MAQGRLPPLRVVDGPTLLRLVVQTRVHEIMAPDEANGGEVREAWHDFADLMRDLGDSAADLAEADRVPLAGQLDLLIAELRRHGFRVVAGAAGTILYVAVLPRGYRQDVRALFAALNSRLSHRIRHPREPLRKLRTAAAPCPANRCRGRGDRCRAAGRTRLGHPPPRRPAGHARAG